MTAFLLNASAFVLAAAASATTFGGAALLAKHQYVVAERASVAAPARPTTAVAPRARRA
jgi:hypothetical protein